MTPLKQARVTRGWSQEELADRAKLPQPTISRAERSGSATTAVAIKIAAALESTVEQLFAKVDESAGDEVEPPADDIGTASTLPPPGGA